MVKPTATSSKKKKVKSTEIPEKPPHPIEEMTKRGMQLIAEATKAVNAFPSGASRDLYCAHPTFNRIVEEQSDRMLGIVSSILGHQNIKGNIQRRQPDEQLELILEFNDVILERINSNLDELSGIRKNPETILIETQISTNPTTNRSGSWNVFQRNDSPISQTSARLLTAKNIPRPQVNFKIPVDNSRLTPFLPKIKDKPNSIKPLAVLPEYGENGEIESYLHPYEIELNKFEPSNSQLTSIEVQEPLEIEKTPLVHVQNEDELQNLLIELRNEEIFAVDLEHHSYRTFQGFTCLMQISTRQKDYIIDALKLREEICILNEVFTNSKILKIFHGADLDVEWMQRDLSLYVVNMFDTHQAAKILGFARLSLAYLLKQYCNIEADKTFQLADWRIRPLPTELIKYARQDTHYLIYIYEMLQNDLLKQGNNQPNLLKTVYQRSTELCKKRYYKPRITSNSHMDLYRKSKRLFDNRQLFALQEIFFWRDKIARLEDESYGYVLPNHMMLQISESLPREMQGILACCNPIPPLVRQNLNVLHQIILKAREQPLVKPIIQEQIVNRVVLTSTKDYNSKLYCPHDLLQNTEFRDDLPTLLGPNKESNENMISLEAIKPIVGIFDSPDNSEDEEAKEKLLNLKKIKFVSPYERYKAVIPFVEQQKREEIEKQAALDKMKLLCPIKKEPEIENQINNEDDIYSLPMKESLKRKRTSDKIIPEEISPPKKRNSGTNNPIIKAGSSSNPRNNIPAEEDKESNVNITPSENEVAEENTQSQKSQTKKYKKYKKFLSSNKTGQDSSKPIEFDYTKVDFKKFQGGSKKAKGIDIKSKFRGKGQNNNKGKNKQFNKLFTFSNVNKKK